MYAVILLNISRVSSAISWSGSVASVPVSTPIPELSAKSEVKEFVNLDLYSAYLGMEEGREWEGCGAVCHAVMHDSHTHLLYLCVGSTAPSFDILLFAINLY